MAANSYIFHEGKRYLSKTKWSRIESYLADGHDLKRKDPAIYSYLRNGGAINYQMNDRTWRL